MKTTSKRLALLARILTLATFFAVIFLLASLLTHDASDPPAGDGKAVHNVCGIYGAYVAHGMLAALGTAGYLALALVMAVVVAYAARGRVTRRYLVTTVSLAVLAFLVLSLVSFDASGDPHRVYTQTGAGDMRNACGIAGATVAYYLLAYAGIGVWLGVAGAAVAAACYLARHPVPGKVRRALGVVVLVAVASGLIALVNRSGWLRPDAADVLPEGLGGVLGQLVVETGVRHVGLTGACLALALALAAGLLLSTDTVVLLLPLQLWRWWRNRRGARRGRQEGAGWRDAGERLKRGLAAARVAIATSDTVDDDEEEYEDDEENEEDEAPDDAAPPRPKRRRAAPKIRLARDRKKQSEPAAEPTVESTARQMQFVDSSEGPSDKAPAYRFPPIDLLEEAEAFDISGEEVFIRQNAANLEGTLRQFGVEAEVVGIDTGPVITQYEVSLGAGIKVGKVISLSDDLAIGLKAPSVRIIAPLPGRGTIGIEVPNRHSKIVRIREAIEDGLPLVKRHNLPLFLGKDTAGNPLVRDLTAMPHLLIGGTTGSGKSVCLNSIISSVLFTRSPRDVKFILVDPKMVEMAMFSRIPHLMCPVVSEMSKVYSILEWLMGKMQERYGMLAEAGVKNIVGYNALSREQIIERFQPTSQEDELRLTYHMPYIILIVDELADLMMSAPKEVEAAITRLAQKSRAVGIHLVLATQRPSVDVVTGLIKSNHPCRLAFQVASRVDSRTIIDCMGAEKLLGRGDMLLMQPGASKLLRSQGAYISEEEISRVVDFVSEDAPREFNRELVQLKPKAPKPARGRAAAGPAAADDASFEERDELYPDAVRIVLQHQRGSVSLLQRKLTIGYGRASRLIDFMAEAGIVGEYQGSQAREVVMTLDQWEANRGEGVGAVAAAIGSDDEDDDTMDDEDV